MTNSPSQYIAQRRGANQQKFLLLLSTSMLFLLLSVAVRLSLVLSPSLETSCFPFLSRMGSAVYSVTILFGRQREMLLSKSAILGISIVKVYNSEPCTNHVTEFGTFLTPPSNGDASTK